MIKKFCFTLLAFCFPIISFSENCSFILTLDNPRNEAYEVFVKQLKQPQTQSDKTSYTPLILTKKQKNEWQFVTLPIFHVIEIDFYTKTEPKTLLGGWTIGFKNDCLIQSVGNKLNDSQTQKLSLNIVNTKGTQENLLQFKMIDEKPKIDSNVTQLK
ncbi:hypothetical protein OAO18_02680 [Francisellaceae bacterium]|nr:hypothetical protein [Francisellaceae bacterium]